MSKEKDLLQNDQEIKAFIYQQVTDLEHLLLHDDSTITVEEKNAKKTIRKMKKNEEIESDFNAVYCYQFSLEFNVGPATEDGPDQTERLNTFGLSDDPYEAIKIAKNKMMNQLQVINSQLVSNEDRLNEINSYINKTNTKH